MIMIIDVIVHQARAGSEGVPGTWQKRNLRIAMDGRFLSSSARAQVGRKTSARR